MTDLKNQLKGYIEDLLSDDELTLSDVRILLGEIKDVFYSPEASEEFLNAIMITHDDYLGITSALENCLNYQKGVNKHFVRNLFGLQERLERTLPYL